MKLKISATDMLSHMELLGLAQIIRFYGNRPSDEGLCTVQLWWDDPETACLGWGTGPDDLSLYQAAEAVLKYMKELGAHDVALRETMEIDGKKGSPLSPRVGINGKSKIDVWKKYYTTRHDVSDEMGQSLFSDLLGSLGQAAYWCKSRKGDSRPDGGASLWEMAPRNRGAEFVTNKYLKMLDFSSRLSVEEIEERLCNQGRGRVYEENKLRNPCGFRPPLGCDELISFIAMNGISAFSTRPVSFGAVGSRSDAVVLNGMANALGQTFFVLPLFESPVALERCLAVCRSEALVAAAIGAISEAADLASGSWLRAHGANYVAVFERFTGGTDNCPEYYARPGWLYEVRGSHG